MQKDFDTWNTLKQRLDKRQHLRTFNEREIWWCSVGMNVGSEVYGKGQTFARPVLVIKKLSKKSFIGVPLTSKHNKRPYRHPFTFKGAEGHLLLDQLRVFDARRLEESMGTINNPQFETIKQVIKDLLKSSLPAYVQEAGG